MSDESAVDVRAVAPIVLYDGECGFCAASVQWLLAHERDDALQFAPLQGPTAARIRELCPNMPDDIDTVVYFDGEHAHLRSAAIIAASSHLRTPWRWLSVTRWIPRPIRDGGYRVLARNRHRLVRGDAACLIPSPAQRVRFRD